MLNELNKLTKWRKFFASWQLGSRSENDGEYKAVVHHRELSILLRCEMSAMAGLLLRNGIITEEEWQQALEAEAIMLSQDYAESYPGWRATSMGMQMSMPEAAETMRNLGFPL